MNILKIRSLNPYLNNSRAKESHSPFQVRHGGRLYTQFSYAIKMPPVKRALKIIQVIALSILTCFIALAFEKVRARFSEAVRRREDAFLVMFNEEPRDQPEPLPENKETTGGSQVGELGVVNSSLQPNVDLTLDPSLLLMTGEPQEVIENKEPETTGGSQTNIPSENVDEDKLTLQPAKENTLVENSPIVQTETHEPVAIPKISARESLLRRTQSLQNNMRKGILGLIAQLNADQITLESLRFKTVTDIINYFGDSSAHVLKLNLKNFEGITDEDIKKIAISFPNLTHLSLKNAQITDDCISYFKTLISLQSLNLASCTQITNISFLSDFQQLGTLSLAYCENISDFSGLKNLSSLKTLDLAGCSLFKDIDFLDGCTLLDNIDLLGCNLVDPNDIQSLIDKDVTVFS